MDTETHGRTPYDNGADVSDASTSQGTAIIAKPEKLGRGQKTKNKQTKNTTFPGAYRVYGPAYTLISNF